MSKKIVENGDLGNLVLKHHDQHHTSSDTLLSSERSDDTDAGAGTAKKRLRSSSRPIKPIGKGVSPQLKRSSRQAVKKASRHEERDQRSKHRKSSTRATTAHSSSRNSCFICNEIVQGDVEEHVDECLRKTGEMSDSSSEYETYEWAGETRVRNLSMIDAPLSAFGLYTTKTGTEFDTPEAVNVDEDESTALYGQPQYTHKDLQKQSHEKPSFQLDGEDLEAEYAALLKTKPSAALADALKLLIDKLFNERQQMRCSICLDRFKTPLTSTVCWHVCCEQCWLSSLSAKRVCPQCGIITSPEDLRRIYM